MSGCGWARHGRLTRRWWASTLARGASHGATLHDRGGPYGATLGAKRVVAVDVTGMPVGGIVVPASTTESRATELLLQHLRELGVTERLELVLVDRATTARAARSMSRRFGLEVRQVFWPDRAPVLRPIALAWRVEVAHGLLGCSRRLAKSLESTTNAATGWLQVARNALLLKQLAPTAWPQCFCPGSAASCISCRTTLLLRRPAQHWSHTLGCR